jgi:hypothetical protein
MNCKHSPACGRQPGRGTIAIMSTHPPDVAGKHFVPLYEAVSRVYARARAAADSVASGDYATADALASAPQFRCLRQRPRHGHP